MSCCASVLLNLQCEPSTPAWYLQVLGDVGKEKAQQGSEWGKLNWMISRGPVQPQLLCNSVIATFFVAPSNFSLKN